MNDLSSKYPRSTVASGKLNENKFLQWFPNNPFARIRCQSFSERMCNGVCGDCRNEREAFRVTRLHYWKGYFAMERIHSGGDPDNLQGLLTPEQMLEAEIRIIRDQKKARFTNEQHSQIIAQAMHERVGATLQ